MLRRRIIGHAFVLFALGPLVIGALAWVAKRYVEGLRGPLSAVLAQPTAGELGELTARSSLALATVLVLSAWPGSLRALFGRDADLVDALPVSESTRWLVVWIESTGRALLPAVVLGAAASVLAAGQVDLAIVGSRLPILWLATTVAAGLALVSVAFAVHVARATLGWLLTAGAVAGALIAQPWTEPRWVLVPLGAVGALVRSALVGERISMVAWSAVTLVGLVTLVVSAVVIPRWRRRDLERARAAETTRHGRRLRLAVLDHLPSSLAAPLRRDLRLIARRFSPAVHLAAGCTLVALAVAARWASDPAFSEGIRRGGLVLGVAVAVLATVSIVPFLLDHQLAMIWLERSAGVDPVSMWRVKVCLAGLLAIVPTVVGMALVAIVGPESLSLRLLTGGQVLLAAFAIASTVGVAAFEIAEEPLLGLIFTGFTGLAVAVLYVAYPQAWWLWLGGHLYLLSVLAGHGPRRVRFTDVRR